ncbi:cysteine desulfurase family protein [Salisediminibacterium beveridgei]|uniref:Cysteine desulfurase n=1 Tax=Salisediminibacterium beveridgei TaxID=632773 RepID=A0A1D7QWY7_9BACI|nr:cysteine desulfurase family protein [Salisediminibacterium beveridgei]AOM83526.1 Cysteine desulfurase [Salisediminibacterium beveridgei]
MIYFDNSSTTPLHPEVKEAMWPYINEEFGNPSSKYYTLAENAKNAVEESRQQISSLIGSQSSEIIFTSCSTESNNFILKGIANDHQKTGRHIITSKVEHKSVLDTCEYLNNNGFEVEYLDVNEFGQVSSDTLVSSIREDTILVSLIWGNNEIGSLNDIEELAKCTKKNNPNTFFHTDATQVLGKVSVDLNKSGNIDFLSGSGHKLFGPKGIGICYIKKQPEGHRTKITPLLHGGDQEFGYRAGTLSVHNIVGMGKASEIAKKEMKQNNEFLSKLDIQIKDSLTKQFDHITFNTPDENKIPGVLNFTIPGANNELIIRALKNDFAISTGSACSLNEPSYVLSAIGLNAVQVSNSFRISLSKFNKTDEINQFISKMDKTINMYSI